MDNVLFAAAVDNELTAHDAVALFCEEMNRRAKLIGMEDTQFNDPVGIDNLSTSADMLRCLLTVSGWDVLNDIWNKPGHPVNIMGKEPRILEVVSTVVASDDSRLLSDSFPIMGGKTGTLSRHGAYNLSVIVDVPDTDERLACVILYADQPNGEKNCRFEAARQAISAAVTKDDGDICARSAAVCRVPRYNPRAYSMLDIPLTFAKNAHEQLQPASMTKLMTALLVLDYTPDLHTKITVSEDDIALLPQNFYAGDIRPGDVITVKDMLYAMLLPSSNSAATILARFAGERIYESRRA